MLKKKKIPARFFKSIDKLVLKFIWKGKGTRIGQTILKKTDKVRGINPLDFKT